MSDKLISNIISKIYFSIVSFFIFIFCLLFVTFAILQNGLFVDKIEFSGVHAEKLYIKWNKKIDFTAKELYFQDSKNEHTLNNKTIRKNLNTLLYILNWFDTIIIEKIKIGDIQATFKYKNNENGFFKAYSKDLIFDSTFAYNSSIFTLNIEKLEDKNRNILAKGQAFFDSESVMLFTNINVNINNNADFTIFSKVDTKKLIYKIASNQGIRDIKQLTSLIKLPIEVKYWVEDAIESSELDILNINGFIDYNDIANAYKNIVVNAVFKNLNYKYNPKLDSIHTTQTDIEFKNACLSIRPKNANSYGMPLDESWLKIDFSKKEELLTLYLLFDGVLNSKMLSILDTYKIKLPLIQKTGTVSTDLTIEVGLRSINVDAKGQFNTFDSVFKYMGLDVGVHNACIKLDNYDVLVNDMNASYQNIINANVDLQYNAKNSEGKITFKTNDINISNVALLSQKKPLNITYTISPKQDLITIESSKWKILDSVASVESIEVPFNLESLIALVPPTLIKFDKYAEGFISGNIDIKQFSADFDIDILKLAYKDFALSQSNTPIKLRFDKDLSIYSKNNIYFNIDGTTCSAENLLIDFKDHDIYLKHTILNIGKYASTKVYAKYDFDKKRSSITLNDFSIKNPQTDRKFYENKKILLTANIDNNTTKIISKELDAELVSNNGIWNLNLKSLNKISKGSTDLQKYNITNGEVTLYKEENEKSTRFKGIIRYPYKILSKNNKAITDYQIKGKISDDKTYININNNIDVKINDSVSINVSDSEINLNEVIKNITDINSTDNNNTYNILLTAKNTAIQVGENRKIISDSFSVQYYNSILTAQLKHKQGAAGFKYSNNEFNLHGEGFNDEFMEHFISLAKFQSGKLNFVASGKVNDFSGVVYINKTIIKDYKTLNNILAFINTVPSLVTFSIPGYNSNGLFVDNAYVKFAYLNDVMHLSDISLDSKEIDIFGNGNLDFNASKIDLTLNLRTDLGVNVSKVPVVGYILMDGDSISTTLNVYGDLAEPKVKSLMAKEIIVAPLNIIKRTLMLPYTIFEDKK